MEEIAVKHLGYYGAMISGSKSGYTSRNSKNIAVFNSNVCLETKKIWWGDLDLTLSKDKLVELSKELNVVVKINQKNKLNKRIWEDMELNILFKIKIFSQNSNRQI